MKHDRLEWIEVLRGLAALAVAAFHSIAVLFVGLHQGSSVKFSAVERIGSYLSIPFHYGYAGVMLFFLLSGFVIHLPYAGGRNSFAYASYLGRRFGRVYPPYAAALLLSIGVASIFPAVIDSGTSPGLIARSFLMTQNYPHTGGPLLELASLQPLRNFALWSLPVELELYIVYPIFLFATLLWGSTRTIVAVGLISVLASASDILLDPASSTVVAPASYLPTFLHYWVIWCAGAWLSDAMVTGRIPKWNSTYAVLGFCALGLSLAARPLWHLARDVEDFFWGTTFFFVLQWLISAPHVARTLSGPRFSAIRYLGKMSYSLYLVHLPIMFVFAAVALHTTNYKTANFLICVLATCIATACAAVFYETVEKPLLRLARRGLNAGLFTLNRN